MKKNLNRGKYKILSKFRNGFNLTEVLISVCIFSTLFTSIFFGLTSLIKMEIRAKEKIYQSIENTNAISNEYYVKTVK